MDVELDFLTGGIRYARPFVLPHVAREPEERRLAEVAAAADARPASLGDRLARVLAHRDVCARTSIYRRYDGVVRGCTALPPGYADAGVLVPIPGAPLGIALAVGGNPRYGALDPAHAGAAAVAEAVGRVSAVGATPAGLTDCLNFGDPTIPAQMGAFVAAIDGLAHAARAFDVPFVSGNVSLYNRSASGNAVAPSPIVAAIGTFDDISRVTTRGFKRAGAPLVVTAPLEAAFGGSVIGEILGLSQRTLPALDCERFARSCALVRAGLANGAIASAHCVGNGGTLAALAKMAFAADGLAFRIDPRPVTEPHGHEAVWFAEVAAFVVEVADADAFARLAASLHVAAFEAGETIAGDIVELGDEHVPLAVLREAWEAPLRDFYGSAA
jgi:phosphoribosylformylglycinamidine synthase